MNPAHLNRQPDIDTLRRQKKRLPSEPPVPARPPGFYTELMRRWNWPPRFESRMPAPQRVDMSAISRENRERRVAAGDSGSIIGVSARADALIKQFRRARP